MTKITVVAKEIAGDAPPWPLLYVVDVADPNDAAEVTEAVNAARREDYAGAGPMEVCFAFAGDVNTVADYRD